MIQENFIFFITRTTWVRFGGGNKMFRQGNIEKKLPGYTLGGVGMCHWYGDQKAYLSSFLRGSYLKEDKDLILFCKTENIFVLSSNGLGRQNSNVMSSPLIHGIHEKLLLYIVWKITVLTQKCNSLAQIGKYSEDAIKQNISCPTISLKDSNKWKWLLIVLLSVM